MSNLTHLSAHRPPTPLAPLSELDSQLGLLDEAIIASFFRLEQIELAGGFHSLAWSAEDAVFWMLQDERDRVMAERDVALSRLQKENGDVVSS